MILASFFSATGLPKPKLTALKNMVTEGEELVLKCQVPEEAPPLTFTFHKLLTPGGPVTRTKKELEKNFTTIEIPVEPGDKILRFQCIASVYSAHGMQESAPSNVELVTVVGKVLCFSPVYFFLLCCLPG